MEAILFALLSCMVDLLLGIATPGSCQMDNRTEYCIAQCPFSTLEGAMNEEENQLNFGFIFSHCSIAAFLSDVTHYSQEMKVEYINLLTACRFRSPTMLGRQIILSTKHCRRRDFPRSSSFMALECPPKTSCCCTNTTSLCACARQV